MYNHKIREISGIYDLTQAWADIRPVGRKFESIPHRPVDYTTDLAPDASVRSDMFVCMTLNHKGSRLTTHEIVPNKLIGFHVAT